MSDATDGEHQDPSIGVGMGGSCPNCRAPVDLGQEFCLECGAAIRFTARQRRQQQQRAETGAASVGSTPPPPPGRNRFPWIPFAIVLVLVIAGIAFALTDGGSSSSKDKGTTSTEPALPTITNSSPTTTSDIRTTTLEDCDPARPLDGTQEAVPSAADAGTFKQTESGSATDQVPSVDPNGPGSANTGDVTEPSAFDTPAADATGDTGAADGTVTVDGNGTICTPAEIAANDTSSDPATGSPSSNDPAATTPVTPSPSGTPKTPPAASPASSSDDWPAGKDGWTVIVAGYKDDEAKAHKLAADLVANGFKSGVLLSTNYRSLCPGIWVAFSGIFETRAQAEAHQAELSAKSYQSTYAREVRKTGAAPTECSN